MRNLPPFPLANRRRTRRGFDYLIFEASGNGRDGDNVRNCGIVIVSSVMIQSLGKSAYKFDGSVSINAEYNSLS